MDRILTELSEFVGSKPDALAVTVESRTGDPWRVLVSTVLSLRCRDEVTAVVTKKLLEEAPTPEKMASLTEQRILELIYSTSFNRTKAHTLRFIADTLIVKHDGKVPNTFEGLITLHGIGRKCANLILTHGFGQKAICVDTHVHRLSNRLSFVRTKTPAETEEALRKSLPAKWWIDINGILIEFGRTHCTPVLPKCSTCPVLSKCYRVGVEKSR